jgi:hypothetical protein
VVELLDTDSNSAQQDSDISDQSADLQNNSPSQAHSKPDSDWSISFEQFIASMLTEQPLVYRQSYHYPDFQFLQLS